jgi:hypothetical protein
MGNHLQASGNLCGRDGVHGRRAAAKPDGFDKAYQLFQWRQSSVCNLKQFILARSNRGLLSRGWPDLRLKHRAGLSIA